jgi:hypothetical protein
VSGALSSSIKVLSALQLDEGDAKRSMPQVVAPLPRQCEKLILLDPGGLKKLIMMQNSKW